MLIKMKPPEEPICIKNMNLDLSTKWVILVSEISNEIVSAVLEFCWKCWNGIQFPRSVEDWCIEAFAWRRESLVNVLGPIIITSLRKAKDPKCLDLNESLELILHGIPKIPIRVKYLIQKVISLKNVGYHEDFDFTQEKFETLLRRLQDYLYIIFDLLAGTFVDVFESRMQLILSDLRSSKRKCRRAQLKSLKHKKVLEKSRQELLEAQQSLDSVVKYEEFEINTEVYETRKRLSFRKHRKSTVSDFSYLVMSDLPSISADESNENYNQEDYKAKLIKNKKENQNMRTLTAHHLPKELKENLLDNSSEQCFNLEEEFRQRMNSNASAESVNLSLAENYSKYEGRIFHIQEKKKTFSISSKEFFRCFESVKEKVINLCSEINFSKEFEKSESSISAYKKSYSSNLIKTLRVESQANADLKNIINIQQWFINKRVELTKALDISYIKLGLAGSKSLTNIDRLFDPRTEEIVTLVSGPCGSGKSHLCNYILYQWRTCSFKHISLLQYDVAVMVSLNELRECVSYELFLEKNILPNMTKESIQKFLSNEIEDLNFILIIDCNVIEHRDFPLLKEMIAHGGSKRILITVRPEYEPVLEYLFSQTSLTPLKVKIRPLNVDTFSLEELRTLGINENYVLKLRNIMESPSMDPNNMTILYVCFIYFTLTINEKMAEGCTSKSNLIAQLLALCLEKLVSKLASNLLSQQKSKIKEKNSIEMKEMNTNTDRKQEVKEKRMRNNSKIDVKAQSIADVILEEFWETSWRAHLGFQSSDIQNKEGYFSVKFKFARNIDPECFFPLMLPINESNYALLSQVSECFAGFYYAQNVSGRSNHLLKSMSCCKENDNLLMDITKQESMKEPLIVAAGVLMLPSKFKKNLFQTLISDFNGTSTPINSFPMWVRLIKETKFSDYICQIVNKQLKNYDNWTSCSGLGCYDGAVATLLRYEAFKPRTIIISERCPSISDLVCGLALCRKVDVVLRQMFQFCMWNSNNMSDELIESLQPTGNLVEFWGYLGAEGCMALRQMNRLREIHIRLTDLEALVNLCMSLDKIQTVQELSLNFDLPKTIPTSTMPRLPFKGTFYLKLHGIRDTSVPWAKEVITKLSDSYASIHFELTKISFDNFQDIKKIACAQSVYIV